jgi:hypothetical protein
MMLARLEDSVREEIETPPRAVVGSSGPRVRGLLVALLALAPLTGCANTHGAMSDKVDEGVAHEIAARDFERAKAFPKAAETYAQSHGAFVEALDIAKVRENLVFICFITSKLSIVSSGEARCVEPTNDPQGSWQRAITLYERAADWAAQVTMLKLKSNALCDQARCRQPDHDAEHGSWEAAGALYAQAAEVCDDLDDDLGRGQALRLQALCLMKGDRSAFTPEATALLTNARRLGDEEANAILLAAGAAPEFCVGCGAGLSTDDRFCRQCGRDRTQAPPEPPRAPHPHPNNPARPGPGGPESRPGQR